MNDSRVNEIRRSTPKAAVIARTFWLLKSNAPNSFTRRWVITWADISVGKKTTREDSKNKTPGTARIAREFLKLLSQPKLEDARARTKNRTASAIAHAAK